MKLGDLEFWLVTDGAFRLDGGAMFGIIPRPMWERVYPPDDRNRIRMSMNSLLIRTAGKWILIETGAGNKSGAKRNDIYALEPPPRLPENLLARGVTPDQIDIVINTHLHFDHCGWNTHLVEGKAVPYFRNAQYIVRRGELAHAKVPNDRDRATYFLDNFVPMEESGQWRLLDSDAEVVPGIELINVPGHTEDMVCVRLRGGGRTVFFFADLVPSAAHLPYVWLPAYDMEPLVTVANKKKWIPQAAREGWIVIFSHDEKTPGGYLREHGGHYLLEPVDLNR
jgi:glyoxylase-like metal-dependent hydrolase (beta-lactamase superfamily II)